MRFNGIIVIIYALLVLVGGMIGFAKAGSVASLVMGMTFSLALLGSAVAMVKGRKLGWYSALALSAVLAAFFGYRYAVTLLAMPAGLMCLLSVTVILALFLGKSTKNK